MKNRYAIIVFFLFAFQMQLLQAQKVQSNSLYLRYLEKINSDSISDSTPYYYLYAAKYLLEKGSLDSAKIFLQKSQSAETDKDIRINALYALVKGMYHLEMGDYPAAMSDYQQSLRLYQKESRQKYFTEWLEIQNDIGRIWIVTNEIEKASSHFQNILLQVKSIPPKYIDSLELSNVYNNIGVICFYDGKMDEAYKNYDRSRTLAVMSGYAESVNVGRSYYNMGLVKEEKGFLVDAGELYEKALKIYIETLGPLHHHIAEVYGSLGNIHLTRYELNKAKYYFQKDLEISQKIYGSDHVEATWGYENLARLYQVEKKNTQAKALFEKVYDIRNTAFNGRHIYISNILLSLAELETNLNESIRLAKQAQTIEYLVTKNPTIGKWHISLHLLEKYIAQHKWSEAKRELAKSVSFGERLFEHQHHSLFIKTYLLAAQLFEKTGQLIESKKYIHKAVQSSLRINAVWDGESLMSLKDIYYVPEFIQTIQYQAQFSMRHGEYSDWINASKWLKHTVNLIQFHQRRRTSDDISKGFSTVYKSLYESGAVIHSLLWEKFNEKEYLNELFGYVERIKYLQTIEDLQGMDVYKLSNLPETTLRKEYQLKKDILYYQSLVEEHQENNLSVTQKLMELFKEEDAFFKKLRKFHPEYYHAKYDNNPITISDIQKTLEGKEAILWHSTFIDSVEYVFLMTQDNIHFKKKTKNDYNEIFRYIFKEKIRQWIVIPDFSHPWNSFEAYRYKGKLLLEHYSFIYNISAKSYFQNTPKSKLVNNKIVAFAPVTFEKHQLRDLKKSQEEVEELEKYFKVKSFVGKAANKEQFFKNALLYGGLHISTHISYNDINPLTSKVYLTPIDSTDNGLLYAHDIFGVPMRTQLVTLSACQSKKDANTHSGIAGIADAFFYNGCKNILMTLWDVEDHVMKEITVGFYKYLASGYSKDKALQLSKLDYIRQADRYKSHPYYWSGIILQGDHNHIGLSPNVWSRNWWWIALFLVVIGGFFFRNKFF